MFLCFLGLLLNPLQLKATSSIIPWSQTSSIPHSIASHIAFSWNGKLFVEGGANTVILPYQFSANILEDNLLNDWVIDGNAPNIFWHNYFLFNQYVYLLGGATSPLVSYSKDIWRSNLSIIPPTWSKIGELPKKLFQGGVFVKDINIYYLGGASPEDAYPISQLIYTAQIDPDTGTLGSWESGGVLPEPLTNFGLVNLDKYVFIVAGNNGTTSVVTKKVWRGEITETGIVENWTPMPDYPFAVERFHITLVGKTILVAGGHTPGGDVADTYFAEISPTGTISTWEAGDNLPGAICCGAMTSVGSYAYLTGGARNGVYLNSVYTTKVTELPLTPTPTSIPTPTPTPIVVPPQPKKVVLVPGMFGSWNSEALLGCKMSNYTEKWSINPVSLAVYSPLIAGLKLGGYEVEMFFYDWRKPVTDITNQFSEFVSDLTNGGNDIDIVGHSQGALIGRDYIEKFQGEGVNKFMAIGGPNKGLLVAYPDWAGGMIWNDNILYRLGQEIVLKHCRDKKTKYETIHEFMPVVQNLLPTFNYLIDKKTDQFVSVETMINKNTWLPTNFPPYWGVKVGTLSGIGQSTLAYFRISPPSTHDKKEGLWTDGKVTGRGNSFDGDGSVLLHSSQLPEADNSVVRKGHVEMVYSIEGVYEVLNFLLSQVPAGLQPNINGEPDSALVVISDSDVEVISPSSLILPSINGLTTVLNPERGQYKFKLNSQNTITRFEVARFKNDGQVWWEDYEFKGKGWKTGVIDFYRTDQ